MLDDLTPAFPLPARGDEVLVIVDGGARSAPSLVAGPRQEWCRVVDVLDRPDCFYPVRVRWPDGSVAGYQQGEILGWHHLARRRGVLAWLRRR